MPLLVLKVGGSLYDLPDLGARLRALLASLSESDRLLVPGGGETADVVRGFDARFGLGPERAHWLALEACSLNARLLLHLVPEAHLVADPALCRGVCVLDPLAFARLDEQRPDHLPHCWDATSDSVAGRAAVVA